MPNSVTDVAGVRVGHYTDRENVTGCTVVLAPAEGAVASVDVRGFGPATHETDLLRPGHAVERAHAIVLTGGSAFGLHAAAGVMQYLEERGVGFRVGRAHVPIVPAAALFDLTIGNPRVRPDAAAGYAACEAATDGIVEEGSVGAGTGATVGKLLGPAFSTKGGLGTASQSIGKGTVVAALVVVNAIGDVVDPQTGAILAGTRKPGGEGWLDSASAIQRDREALLREARTQPSDQDSAPFSTVLVPSATTIGVVATDARLTKEQANIVATMAHAGLARTLRPAHMMLDGDTLFVLATGGNAETLRDPIFDLSAIGHTAAQVVAEAIVRAVKAAESLGGVPALRDLGEKAEGRRQ